MHAGTFSLSGFSCRHAPPPRSHPVSLIRRSRHTAVSNIKTTWRCLAKTTEPSDLSKHIQRSWDAPVTTAAYNVLMSTSQSPFESSSSHSTRRRLLLAPPLTAVGLRLSDEPIRIAIGYRLGRERTYVNPTHAYVAQWSTPEVCMDCLAARVDPLHPPLTAQ